MIDGYTDSSCTTKLGIITINERKTRIVICINPEISNYSSEELKKYIDTSIEQNKLREKLIAIVSDDEPNFSKARNE